MADDDTVPPSGVVVNNFLINWVQSQLKESGITDHADYGGISATVRPMRGLKIQYYTISGEPIENHFKIRLHPDDVGVKPDEENYNAPRLSKYWQPKGQRQAFYWPRVVGADHPANIGDFNQPIFIVEGEKKALKLQAELIARGITGSVIGLPGVMLKSYLVDQFKTMQFRLLAGGKEFNRIVWLVFDWNDQARAEDDTRNCENRLFLALSEQGAKCVALRWDAEHISGVQKIDDYLVAGGDLKEAMEFSARQGYISDDPTIKELLTMNENWAGMLGQYVAVSGPHLGVVLSANRFHEENAHLTIMDYSGRKPKELQVSRLWAKWPGKNTLAGLAAVPPAYGEAPAKYIWKEDLKYANVCRGWGRIPDLPPWENEVGTPTHLIDTLLENFCETESHLVWLRQHIAHALRQPHIHTSQVVVLCGVPGSGKSMLIQSFQKLGGERGAVREVSIDSDDDFNSECQGAVIAFCEEPSRKSRKDVENRIKKMTGSPTIRIRRMNTDGYEVENNLHLFICTNNRYIDHLGKDDRRYNFFMGKERIGLDGTGFAVRYAEFMDSSTFRATWRDWALGVSLEGYNPQLLGPASKARDIAIGLSATTEEMFFEYLTENEIEVGSNDQFQSIWNTINPNTNISPEKLGRLMHANGFTVVRQIKTGGVNKKYRAKENWLQQENAAWLEQAGGPKY